MDGVGETVPARSSFSTPTPLSQVRGTSTSTVASSDTRATVGPTQNAASTQDEGGDVSGSQSQKLKGSKTPAGGQPTNQRAGAETATDQSAASPAVDGSSSGSGKERRKGEGRDKTTVASSTLIARAAKGEWNALYHASPSQRNDKALVGAAVHGSWRAFFFASNELKADRDMVRCNVI
jgi:hypothetical protein